MDTALTVSHETEKKNRTRTRTRTSSSVAREGESLTTLQNPQKLMRSNTHGHGHHFSSSLRAFQTTPLGSQGLLRGFGFPFSSAQWQELQRQALIFKHFMASVPVPPDLLLPSSAKCFPEAPHHLLFYTNNEIGVGGAAEGCYRFSAGGDPEPGRCRRTDGKKWRCSRDVEPGMKYCERHVHRGRPRSRKPVELLHKTKLTTTITTTPTTAPPSTTHELPVFKFPFQSMEPPAKDHRYVEAGSEEWELMHLKMGQRSDPLLHHYDDQYNNLNYTTLNNHCYPFLNPDLSSLEDPPRSFIDAWSNENSVKTSTTSVSSTAGKLPLSTLTLSMSGIAEETDQIEMGLSLSDVGAVKYSQTSSWMGSGGPLAEVLHNNGCSSSSSRNSHGELMNLMGNGSSHEVSPEDSPLRPVSSPSGVLQKTLVSLSESSSSSSSSSPTLATTSKQDMALQWLTQSKQ